MYRTLNEIRLITGNPDVPDAINTVLRGYRSVVETRSWTFPNMNPERKRAVTLLREDLGIA